MKWGKGRLCALIGVGVFAIGLEFIGGMPIVVLLWGVLVYGAILFIAYKARGDWGTMFGLIFPLSIVFIALFAGMMYVALNFEPLTPILMWSLDPPLLQ